jgi:uncharacterized protein YnzC (UPF0291/DUF896 family)
MTDSFFADELLPKKKTKKQTEEEDESQEDIRHELKEASKKGLQINLNASET